MALNPVVSNHGIVLNHNSLEHKLPPSGIIQELKKFIDEQNQIPGPSTGNPRFHGVAGGTDSFELDKGPSSLSSPSGTPRLALPEELHGKLKPEVPHPPIDPPRPIRSALDNLAVELGDLLKNRLSEIRNR